MSNNEAERIREIRYDLNALWEDLSTEVAKGIVDDVIISLKQAEKREREHNE